MQRNTILSVLRGYLSVSGFTLDVARNSGKHTVRAVHIAALLPDVRWQPTDPDPRSRASVAAHARFAGLANLLPPPDRDAVAAD